MVKTITIKDDVYKKLVAQKRKEESFSDLFERLVKNNLHSGIDALKKLRESRIIIFNNGALHLILASR